MPRLFAAELRALKELGSGDDQVNCIIRCLGQRAGRIGLAFIVVVTP
jgi:hypothetical protein